MYVIGNKCKNSETKKTKTARNVKVFHGRGNNISIICACLWLSRRGNWEASDKPDREWFKDAFILWRDPLFNVDGHAILGGRFCVIRDSN